MGYFSSTGTNLLPKEMEFFNYCDPDLLHAMNTPPKSAGNHHQGAGRAVKSSGSPPRTRPVSPSPSEGQEEALQALVSSERGSVPQRVVVVYVYVLSC